VTYHLVKIGAILAAATLFGLSMGPAAAAAPAAQASANGLTLAIAGSPVSTGETKATNAGKGEARTGTSNPPIDVLENQDVLDIGVIAQNSSAKIENGDGVSRACAGVAGDGAVVADVGESDCLTPGDPVGVNIANLDLTGVRLINPESALGALDPLLQPLADQLVGPLTRSVTDALAPLSNVGITGTLGAVQSQCVANPSSAEGTANIVDTKLSLGLPGNNVELVEFPASPEPNTKLLTDLDEVVNVALDAVQTDLDNTLNKSLAQLSPAIQELQDKIVSTFVAQIADQLGPLEENVLDATLNKQTVSSDGKQVEVTALDLQVLPAARQFGGFSLVSAEIATVNCGLNAQVNGPDSPDSPDGPDSPDAPDSPGGPDVPTTVDAGATNGGGINNVALVGGLLMLGGAAGLVGYRRLLGR
jgi:hypothetical protein